MLRLPITCCLLAAATLAKPQPLLIHPSNVDEHPSSDQVLRLDQLPPELRPYSDRHRQRDSIVDQLFKLDENGDQPRRIGNKDIDDQPLPVSDVSDITLPPGNYSYTSHPDYGADMYPDNHHTGLRLNGTDGQFISFSCDQFWLEDDHVCRFDFLSINGQRFCGRRKVTTMTATSLELVFHTDSSLKRLGFSCRVEVPPPTPDSSCECGDVDSVASRILRGGDIVAPGQFPWQAGIFTSGTRGVNCSGAVIDNRYVMMPTRCSEGTNASDFQVVLGEFNNGTADAGEQRFSVLEIKTRQDNTVQIPTHISNRMFGGGLESTALLQLDHEVTFTDTVQPLCLPSIDHLKRYTRFFQLSDRTPLQTRIRQQQMKLAFARFLEMLAWIEDNTTDAQRYCGA